MNILILTQFFASSRDGGSLLFYNITNSLSAKDQNFHVVCNITVENSRPNIFIHRVRPRIDELNHLPTKPQHNIQYIMDTIVTGLKIIDKYDIDLIHSNSYIPILAGSILSKIKRVPLVVTIHDVFTNNEAGGWQKWIEANNLPRYYSLMGKLMERICLSMPNNLYHTVSKATSIDLLRLKPKSKIKIVYPSIDPSNYSPAGGIVYENFILYIGRLVYYKGVDVLIKSF